VPLVLLRLFLLGSKNPAYRQRWQERFGFLTWNKVDNPVIWIHAVSVGEVNAAAPIINNLLEEYPNHLLLVTTVTPTGAITVEKQFGNNVRHCYLPYDLPYSVKKFLNVVKPSLLITMETEIWPNLYQACKHLKIPILIINARLSQQSAKRYRLVSKLMQETLSLVDIIAAQTKSDAERFISFGAVNEKVFVTGNLKFDINVPPSINEQAQSLKRYFSVNRPIWIAASTHDGEDEIILNAHVEVMKEYPDAILIIAPRHPERIDKVASHCKNRGLKYVKRTVQKPFTDEHAVYLLDTLGELQLHYAASQVAFVGGSLVAMGGQNMMEPASLGIPVITGPHTFNFTEITELLLERDVLIRISDEQHLAQEVCQLLSDANRRHLLGEIGREVIESNKGNIDRLMKLITPYLSR
jgi:3-deoxy-D-manno-octulosonic-acid transferase